MDIQQLQKTNNKNKNKYNFFKKTNMINRVDSNGNIDKNEFKNITIDYFVHLFYLLHFFLLVFVDS
jgi:hypothetical protein